MIFFLSPRSELREQLLSLTLPVIMPEREKRVFHWLCLGVAHGISTHDSLPRISHTVLTHSQKNQVVPSYLAPGRGENSWQTALMNTQTGIPSAP